MVTKKRKTISLLLAFCLCLNLLFPGFAIAKEGVIGGDNYYGIIDDVALYNTVITVSNHAPTVTFINPPGSIHKLESVLTFKIKSSDPEPEEQNLMTTIEINGNPVNVFTAKDMVTQDLLEIGDGKLPAIKGREYQITINNKNDFLEGRPDSFPLKVITTDSCGAVGDNTVIITNYNTTPSIETSLTTNQKISKHEPKFSFNITPRDPDTIDKDFNVELYLVIGGKEVRVNEFIAGGAEITDGNLAAKSNQTYAITIDKSLPTEEPLLPNTVDNFTLKAVVSDGCQAKGVNETPLIHDNTLPVVEITGLTDNQRVRKSKNILEFEIKVTDADIADADKLEIEFYILALGSEQKITEFTVNDVSYTQGKFIAQSGEEYQITLNKGVYVPFYANNFILKAVAIDTCEGKGEDEVSLVHFTDILAQWSLDSVKERIAVESSGNNNHRIIHGATLTTGIISNALEFDGTDDYINIPKSSFNNLPDWTFEAWVKPVGPGYIYSEGNPIATMVIEMKEDNSINIGTWHEDRLANWDWFNTGADALTRDVWNHLVVTLENGAVEAGSGTVKCYVNGVLVEQPEPGSLGKAYDPDTKVAALGGNVGVKAGEGLNSFSGCIDEVALYGCALSALEVERNYEKVVFLENIKMTDVSDPNKQTADCLLGSSIQNKLEFDLTKPVNKLTLEFNLPSNVSINRIDKILPENVEMENVTIKGRRIILEQPLAVGHYELELFLALDTKLDLTTQSYSDQNEITTNYECAPFVLQVVDFPDLL